ncbi:hypothetical protein BDV3_006530 [Batrachochytrium dendrobatidis]
MTSFITESTLMNSHASSTEQQPLKQQDYSYDDDLVISNKHALHALHKRVLLIKQSLTALSTRNHTGIIRNVSDRPDVRSTIASGSQLLGRIMRYIHQHVAKIPLRQLLSYSATAHSITQFDLQLSDFSKIALSPDSPSGQSDVATALQLDVNQLPLLLEQNSSILEVRKQYVESLVDIERCLLFGLVDFPPESRSAIHDILSRLQEFIISKSGRVAYPVKLWSVDSSSVYIDYNVKIGFNLLGKVFKGECGGRDVCVQLISGMQGQESFDVLAKEAESWFLLHHPNIVKIWRICLNTDVPFLIMPLMHTDIAAFLKRNTKTSVEVRIGFIIGIAKGLKYLHSLPTPIIHGDIKASNVLFGFDGTVAITDVGMTKIKSFCNSASGRRASSIRWLSPERYKRGYQLAQSSDTFGFAMTCWEIITGHVPFAEERENDIVKDWIKDGERPDRPENIPDVLWDVITDCWHQDPEMRPSFENIMTRLSILSYSKGPVSESRPAMLPIPSTMRMQINSDAKHDTNNTFSLTSPLFPPAATVSTGDDVIPPMPSHIESHEIANKPDAEVIKPIADHDDDADVSSIKNTSTGVELETDQQSTISRSTPIKSTPSTYSRRRSKQQVEKTRTPTSLKRPLTSPSLPPSQTKVSRRSLSALDKSTKKAQDLLFETNSKKVAYEPKSIIYTLPDGGDLEVREGRISEIEFKHLLDAFPKLTHKLKLTMQNFNRYAGEMSYSTWSAFNSAQRPRIATNSAKRVIALRFIKDEAKGGFNGEIHKLTMLEGLQLVSNQYPTNMIPDELCSLVHLKQIFIDNCAMNGVIPSKIGNLTALMEMRLTRLKLSGDLPVSLGNLTNLTILDLRYNGFTGCIPPALGNLTKLSKLNLSYNAFTGSIPPEIGNLVELVEICISSCRLEGIIPLEFGNLVNLEKLDLSRNYLKGPIITELSQLKKIKYLDLCMNYFDLPIADEFYSIDFFWIRYDQRKVRTDGKSSKSNDANANSANMADTSSSKLTDEVSDTVELPICSSKEPSVSPEPSSIGSIARVLATKAITHLNSITKQFTQEIPPGDGMYNPDQPVKNSCSSDDSTIVDSIQNSKQMILLEKKQVDSGISDENAHDVAATLLTKSQESC